MYKRTNVIIAGIYRWPDIFIDNFNSIRSQLC